MHVNPRHGTAPVAAGPGPILRYVQGGPGCANPGGLGRARPAPGAWGGPRGRLQSGLERGTGGEGMAAGAGGSVTRWIDELKAGEDAAVQPLWERYFARLVRLARAKLRVARRGASEDEEDAALSAFNSFCAGVARG